jgi:hypothetical protein
MAEVARQAADPGSEPAARREREQRRRSWSAWDERAGGLVSRSTLAGTNTMRKSAGGHSEPAVIPSRLSFRAQRGILVVPIVIPSAARNPCRPGRGLWCALRGRAIRLGRPVSGASVSQSLVISFQSPFPPTGLTDFKGAESLIRAFNDTDPFEKLGHSRLTTDHQRLATRDPRLTTPPPRYPKPLPGRRGFLAALGMTLPPRHLRRALECRSHVRVRGVEVGRQREHLHGAIENRRTNPGACTRRELHERSSVIVERFFVL